MQVSWTLADFYVPASGFCDVSLTQQPFNCSREGAEQLLLKLEVWMLSRDSFDNICSLKNTCSLLKDRSSWVDGLNFNTPPDPADADVISHLNCIV